MFDRFRSVRPPARGRILVATMLLLLGLASAAGAADALPERAAQALRRATDFYSQKVASHGGYVYRYSADLTKREGEGKTDVDTVWVQPPGTPSVGFAYLDAHELTGQAYLLDAAVSVGRCLVRGQLRSGGWRESIEFAPDQRKKFAYRDEPDGAKRNNLTTFDDDKTQSAARFLVRLDQRLKFQDAAIHEAARFALDSIVKAQRPNGGWPQVYREFPKTEDFPVRPASSPETWSRTYPGGPYWNHYTLNDNAIADTIELLFLAAKVYDEPAYRRSATRAGDFLILAQLPEPQPAWAQQYDDQLQPAWARKFEPPAVTGGESQRVIRTLLDLYVETGDKKYLEPIPRALAYLKRSRLPDGKLARFYELRTNKPLYFTRQYELTYDDSDLPTHYSFKIGDDLDSLDRRFTHTAEYKEKDLVKRRALERRKTPDRSKSLSDDAQRLIESLDERGAWVEDGRLKYHGKNDDVRRVIDSATFAKNLVRLASYVAAEAPSRN